MSSASQGQVSFCALPYALTGLIGVLHPSSAFPAEREYLWRRPLQAIYRIAGLNWL